MGTTYVASLSAASDLMNISHFGANLRLAMSMWHWPAVLTPNGFAQLTSGLPETKKRSKIAETVRLTLRKSVVANDDAENEGEGAREGGRLVSNL